MKWQDMVMAVRAVAVLVATVATALAAAMGDAGFLVPALVAGLAGVPRVS